ncbi:MAG: hypothetical protein JXB39_03900 [Deltaproteobacteria bacterium]|nr:hypothetical protein [Deltaproteobacteria bacterium]
MRPYASLLLAPLLIGCGPSEQHCRDVEDAAAGHVLDAIEVDQPCTSADNCEVVQVNGSCFDVCERVIAVANHEVYEQAVAEAEAEDCVDYDGCTLIAPPCVPVHDVACGADGQCTAG